MWLLLLVLLLEGKRRAGIRRWSRVEVLLARRTEEESSSCMVLSSQPAELRTSSRSMGRRGDFSSRSRGSTSGMQGRLGGRLSDRPIFSVIFFFFSRIRVLVVTLRANSQFGDGGASRVSTSPWCRWHCCGRHHRRLSRPLQGLRVATFLNILRHPPALCARHGSHL